MLQIILVMCRTQKRALTTIPCANTKFHRISGCSLMPVFGFGTSLIQIKRRASCNFEHFNIFMSVWLRRWLFSPFIKRVYIGSGKKDTMRHRVHCHSGPTPSGVLWPKQTFFYPRPTRRKKYHYSRDETKLFQKPRSVWSTRQGHSHCSILSC